MAKKILFFVLYIILILSLWNLFEWIWLSFITRSTYRFDGVTCLVIPLVSGIGVYAVLFLMEQIQKNRAKKKAAVSETAGTDKAETDIPEVSDSDTAHSSPKDSGTETADSSAEVSGTDAADSSPEDSGTDTSDSSSPEEQETKKED